MLRNAIAVCLSTVLALPAVAQDARQAVVFDIDGTLTPNVYAIAIARPNAAEAATLYADAGIEIIYLTARVRLFQDGVDEIPSRIRQKRCIRSVRATATPAACKSRELHVRASNMM